MATRVINFYNDFSCLADKCPNTCCRGWRISIDDDTVKKYREEKGREGLRLRALMSFGKEKEIRKFMGRCTNETKDGLCRLELNGRKDLMPEVCRIYPRRGVKIDDDMEVTFELSCPFTAQLFLENMSDVDLIDYEGEEIQPVWIQDKFNTKYYDDLLHIRDKVLSYIKAEESIPQILNDLYAFFRRVHSCLLVGDKDIRELSIGHDVEFTLHKPTYCFYSFEMFDKVLINDLNDGRFRFADPLHLFINEYNNIFAKMTAAEADSFFNDKMTKMIDEYPILYDKYKAYLIYYLIQSMYSSYESVTFYKEYLMGAVYLMALMTTDLVDYVNGRDMSDVDRQVKNLNGCERRFRHNVAVKKDISHRIEEEFIKKKEGFIF